MRDTRRFEHRPEVRLDRVQVIWLTLGALVAMGLMFALGVVVGRRAAQFDDPRRSAPIAEIDADSRAHDELTFYDSLSANRARPPMPPRHGAETNSEPTPVRAPAPAPAARPRPAAPPAPGVADKAPAGDTPPPAPAADDAVRAALDAGPATVGDYTVQVSAFQSMAEARAFSAQLERKGFKPFVVRTAITGKGTWYRVRMGRFNSEEQAKDAKGLLAGADIPAWVLRTE